MVSGPRLGEIQMDDRELEGLLRSKGVSPTSQRMQVGKILLSQPQHVCAEEILNKVHEAGYRVSKATVYNTLNLFVDRGLIRELNVDPTRMFYDSSTHAHHHFYNVDTGKLMDVPLEEVNFATLPTLPEGTVAESVEITIKVRDQH
jgi:Fur family iron response transcriptional regulator